jgi:hypothetical protein
MPYISALGIVFVAFTKDFNVFSYIQSLKVRVFIQQFLTPNFSPISLSIKYFKITSNSSITREPLSKVP